MINRSSLTFYVLGKKYGFNLNKMVKFVNENQYWSEDQIQAYQLDRLKKIITHAYDNVDFYRKFMQGIGMVPDDFKNIEDLKHFPIIDKGVIVKDRDSFISKDYQKYRPMLRSTGGTTGVPFKYYNDAASWGLNWATKIKYFSWGAYSFGEDKIAVFKGGSMHRKGSFSTKELFWRLLQNSYSVPIMNMTAESIESSFNDIMKKNIKIMKGYPSSLYTFSKHLDTLGIVYKMRSIFTTAEMLYDYQRQLIEKVFNCKIIDGYGCGDGMAAASQCEQREKYHVSVESSYMELLDENGDKVRSGEEGEVVVTSLHDFAMPFIRYKPGDLAVLGTNDCSCKRTTPVLDKIIGRSSDVFELPNGRFLNGLSIPFESMTEMLERFQLVHEERDLLVLNIIPKNSFGKSHEQKIMDLLKHNAGPGIRIRINKVDHIEQTVAGKFRYIISKVKK